MAKNKRKNSAKKEKKHSNVPPKKQKRFWHNPILVALAIIIITPFTSLVLVGKDSMINAKLEHICSALAAKTYPNGKIDYINNKTQIFDDFEYALALENPNREEMDGISYRGQYNSLDIAYSYGERFQTRDVKIKIQELIDGTKLSSTVSCHFKSELGYLEERLRFDRFTYKSVEYPSGNAWFVYDGSVDYIEVGDHGYYVSMDSSVLSRWAFLYKQVKALFV
ncbi:hypothetical protein OTK51_04130 [Vibrio scophthalmi]|uniref:hypothetical protein n=1 Tax=Vibrio scophthalmi TaxID=45658 RepID=UPI002283B80A|nr:hypothetical protein [Vibrio scophthalmi]MCY9802614.1 hypothetical protein [Vibrio scophthalmi]